MHIVRPGGDRPRVADTLFVVEAVLRRHNKMQRRTAAGNQAARCSLFVEFVYREELQTRRQDIGSPARNGTSSPSSPKGSVAATFQGSFLSVMLPSLRGSR